MSASNEWTEYHLTPRGWETGTEKTDFAWDEKKRPADAVQTVKVKDYLSSVFSKMEHSRDVTWEHPDKQGVAKLLKQFGEAPDHI